MGQKCSLLNFSPFPPVGAAGDGAASEMFSESRKCQWCIVALSSPQWFLLLLIISNQSVSCIA